MTNRGNNQNRQNKNRPRYDLLIEGPQIFQQTASTPNNHHINVAIPNQLCNTNNDFLNNALTLNLNRTDYDSTLKKSITNNSQHIIQNHSFIQHNNSNKCQQKRQ